jgi:signal transduction histidine kinase
MEIHTKQFSVLCDMEGHVSKVLQDDNHLLPVSLVGKMLFSIVAASDLDKFINFYLELKDKRTAIGWEINLISESGAETFSFFGGVFDEQIGIAAATTKNSAELLFGDLTRINNEQANMIRALSKENEKLHLHHEEPQVMYYEELSRLNNDLVNMQRELSKKNRELDELNKLKNQFLGIAAHDLRNPLAVIMGYSEYVMLDAEETLSPDHTRMLNSILSSSEFMLRLLNDLLDVSAIESGNLNLCLAKADLGQVIKNNVEFNNVVSQKKGITIQFNETSRIPEILFDEMKIEQVLNNLISNAVKFSPPGTEVDVGLVNNGDSVVVSVSDNGPGIPEAELGRLFLPFERTSVKTTGGEKSTGLGLSIVRKLILGHKGKIWVESTIGKGSTFYFSLPVNDLN